MWCKANSHGACVSGVSRGEGAPGGREGAHRTSKMEVPLEKERKVQTVVDFVSVLAVTPCVDSAGDKE